MSSLKRQLSRWRGSQLRPLRRLPPRQLRKAGSDAGSQAREWRFGSGPLPLQSRRIVGVASKAQVVVNVEVGRVDTVGRLGALVTVVDAWLIAYFAVSAEVRLLTRHGSTTYTNSRRGRTAQLELCSRQAHHVPQVPPAHPEEGAWRTWNGRLTLVMLGCHCSMLAGGQLMM